MFALILGGTVVEFGSRLYVRRVLKRDFVSFRHEYDAYRNHRLKPNYRFNGVTHNAQGFRRDRDVSLRKAPGEYRIFLMGGSTAYGVSAPAPFKPFRKENILRNNETIDFYLEHYLQEKFPGNSISVINAAVTGYWTHHHLIYLNQRILRFEPDMILFLDGHNDYYKFHAGYDQFESYYYSEKIVTDILNSNHPLSGLFLAAEWLSTKSTFWYLVKNTLDVRFVSERMRSEKLRPMEEKELIATYTENAEQNLLKIIERIILLLKAEGVQPVFLLQPELIFDDTKPLTPEEKEALLLVKQQTPYCELRLVHPIAVQRVQALSARTGVPFFDLTGIFSGIGERTYIDYAHLTPLGNRLLAEYVGDRIAPLIHEQIRP